MCMPILSFKCSFYFIIFHRILYLKGKEEFANMSYPMNKHKPNPHSTLQTAKASDWQECKDSKCFCWSICFASASL